MTLDTGPAAPSDVLARVAQRLGVRTSRRRVRELVMRHEDPGSLPALVEAAEELGLEATPAEANIEALVEDVSLPAIVHFGDRGFAALERIDPEGPLTVSDGPGASRVITRDAFVSAWSGIVVLFERSRTAPPEAGYVRRRLAELLLDEWSLPRRLGAVAGIGAAMLAVLVVRAVALAEASERLPAALVALATAVGATLSLSLSRDEARDGAATRGLCQLGRFVDCDAVLRSRWARVLGVPLAEAGLAWHGALLLLIAATGAFSTAALACLVASIASVALVGVQIALRRLCPICMAVHLANALGAATFFFMTAPAAEAAAPQAALLAVLFALLALFALPYGRTRRLAEELSRKQTEMLASPFGTLAEMLAQPRTVLDATATVPIDASPPEAASRELLVIVHPFCPYCRHRLEEITALVEQHPDRVRASIAIAPTDPDDAVDFSLCRTLVAIGLRHGGRRLLDVLRAVKTLRTRLSAADITTELRRELGELEAVDEDAARAVTAAGTFAKENTPGLPAVFVDGRRFSGPIAHIAALVTDSLDPSPR